MPLFDQYGVDLVVCGHDHDYERSFPVRGYDSNVGVEAATGQTVDTRRPHPVTTTDTGTFDTSEGTVFLVLGGGGTNANLDNYGLDQADGLPQAKVFTQPNRPVETSTPGVWARAAADAREDAIWSAKRDPTTGYGIGVFDLDPGSVRGGETSISVSYYHAPGADPTNPNTGATGAPNPNYSQFEQFTLVRPRSIEDGAGARRVGLLFGDHGRTGLGRGRPITAVHPLRGNCWRLLRLPAARSPSLGTLNVLSKADDAANSHASH